MRRTLVGLGVLLLMCTGARAQEYPKVEIFGGYSYGNFGPTTSVGDRTSVNGWNASVGVNVNQWFGLASDFSGHYGDFHFTVPVPPIACTPGATCVIDTSGNDKYHNFMFGPQFSLRKEKVTPFVRFLIGGSHLNESGTTTFPFTPPPPPIPPTFKFSTSSTNFAFALGGGADYKLTERVAWRLQADYLQTQINRRTQNDLRVSTGLVFRF